MAFCSIVAVVAVVASLQSLARLNMISLASWPVPLLALVVLGEPHQCWRYLVSECFRVWSREEMAIMVRN